MEFQQIQDINLIFVIIGNFIAISIGIFLLVNKSAKNKANKYLGALMLSINFFFLTPFLYRYNLLEQFPHVVGLPRLVPFLLAPLTYFYIRACTQKGFKLRPIDWLHFIPLLLEVWESLPIFTLSGPEKIAHHLNYLKTGAKDYPIVLLLKAIYVISYFAIAVKLIFRYKNHINNTTSAIDAAFHRWLLLFIIILCFPILGMASFNFGQFKVYSPILLFLGFLSFLLSIYIATLVKPQLFHAFPHQMLLPKSTEEQKQKYENSNLKDDQKEKYVETLQAYMIAHKPFHKADLTLAQLSEATNIPAHYLSQVVNEKLNCNFLDFINGYRVKAAQEMLVNPKLNQYTILSIAYDAGFNSKSTFYAAFKKTTGVTPSQYRKRRASADV